MSHKVTGIIIAVFLIMVALLVMCLSKVRIKSKDANTTTTITNSTAVVTTTETQSTMVVTTERTTSGDSLNIVNDESVYNYDTAEMQITGSVASKVCYQQGNQLVYLINISTGLSSDGNVKYYCAYSVYSGLQVGDKLSITYKQVSDGVFSVISVSRAV